ncbi:MAG: hypothetical protein Q4A82_06475 [Corynebacterium sp.]|nr:hypothetical protein [Corynebacterium sp.]
MSIAIPVGVYIVALFGVLSVVTGQFIPAIWVWPFITLVVLALAVWAGSASLPIGWAMVIIGFAPILCIFGSDTVARRLASKG